MSGTFGASDSQTNNMRYWFCNHNRKISECTQPISLPIDDRLKLVKENSLCINCLSNLHRSAIQRLVLELTVAVKDTTLYSIDLVTIVPMAHAFTRTSIMQLAVITQKHPNHQMKPKQSYIHKLESPPSFCKSCR